MMVSIVVTCYNYGRYLSRCLDSVLSQTYTDIEVVVIDDGSTDNTPEVIKPYLNDSRVVYSRQRNQGQTVAKNAGIRLSSGEVIAFLDADDLWLPDKLARQMPLFDNPSVGVTYTGFGFIDEQNRSQPAEPPQGYLQFRRGRVTRWLGFDNFVPFSTTAVRRSLIETHGDFDVSLRMGIDWDIWLRLSCVTEFDFVPDRLILYRVGHADQMSKDKRGRFAAADVIFNRFVARHPDAFSREDLREIEFYTSCLRARAYRQLGDLRTSTALLLRAVRLAPFARDPYVGLVRNAMGAAQRRARRRDAASAPDVS